MLKKLLKTKYYYVDNESEQWIANRLNYSVPSIQKKKYIYEQIKNVLILILGGLLM